MLGEGSVDVMHGSGGPDAVKGKGETDRVFGDDGNDFVKAALAGIASPAPTRSTTRQA